MLTKPMPAIPEHGAPFVEKVDWVAEDMKSVSSNRLRDGTCSSFKRELRIMTSLSSLNLKLDAYFFSIFTATSLKKTTSLSL